MSRGSGGRPAGPVTVLAPAKINLGLEVLGRRADGFHELVTIFQAIRLSDRIEIAPRRRAGIELELMTSGMDPGPPDRNLAVRAARVVLPELRDPPAGLRIRLWKRIPIGAGLGGGSADAAAVLEGLLWWTRTPLAASRRRSIAAGLGSDVAFFLEGGTQLGRGRGDRLEPIPPFPPREILLVYPNVSVPTSSIFGAFDLPLTPPGPLASMVSRDFPGGFWRRRWLDLRNDLQMAVLAREPILGSVLEDMQKLGSEFVRVTGSGSCVFGLPPGRKTAERSLSHFRARGFWCRLLRPWRHGCWVLGRHDRGL